MINATFCFNPVRSDFIQPALDSLYKYTDMTNNKVVVVDQTQDGLKLSRNQVHLVLKPWRNLGFAKSMNEAFIHGIRWNSKFIIASNDDLLLINKRWWEGILETFATDDRILVVNPECPRVPMWGYGRPHGEYTDIIEYKKEFTDFDYDYLLAGEFEEVKQRYPNLPASFPLHKVGVCDAIAMWMPVFKTECFEKIGLFDEKFYPGGGEDMDMDGRIYREGYRAVGTTRSWTWHWWGASKDKTEEYKGMGLPIDDTLVWNNLDELWPPDKSLSWNDKERKYTPTHMDPWGHVTLQDGSKKPMYRVPEIGIVDI